MRKVVVSEFISLDGVIEEPGEWHFPYWSDEMGSYKGEEMGSAGALLLGRVTYEAFAAVWPSVPDEEGGAEMNGLPKYVASKSLEEPLEWNNSSLITGDLTEEITDLKEQPGKDILVYGSGDLIGSLMERDLVDEFRLMVHPVVVGSGQRLFDGGVETTHLRLVDTQTFPSGVVVLTYEPQRGE